MVANKNSDVKNVKLHIRVIKLNKNINIYKNINEN